MDPWLEHPNLWPDVHNSLIAAIRDAIAEQLPDNYFVALEERILSEEAGEIALVSRPYLAGIHTSATAATHSRPFAEFSGTAVIEQGGFAVEEVEVPVADALRETFLEIRSASEDHLVTVIELLSPSNKTNHDARAIYERKRHRILNSDASFVEIDLLRDGKEMRVLGATGRRGDYRILISRYWERPRSKRYVFSMQHEIPDVPIPLARGDIELSLKLNDILHQLYERARYHLRINYNAPAYPSLDDAQSLWAASRRPRQGSPAGELPEGAGG